MDCNDGGNDSCIFNDHISEAIMKVVNAKILFWLIIKKLRRKSCNARGYGKYDLAQQM